jgi:DnaJ-class molecular chaperone
MESMGNYYRILDVPYEATFSEIKEAYRKKVKEVHPDKEEGNAEQFKRVKEAFEILSDAEKRRKYDGLLFKRTQNINLKLGAPAINVISIKKNRKSDTLVPVMINAAVILIGVLGNAYLKKK